MIRWTSWQIKIFASTLLHIRHSALTLISCIHQMHFSLPISHFHFHFYAHFHMFHTRTFPPVRLPAYVLPRRSRHVKRQQLPSSSTRISHSEIPTLSLSSYSYGQGLQVSCALHQVHHPHIAGNWEPRTGSICAWPDCFDDSSVCSVCCCCCLFVFGTFSHMVFHIFLRCGSCRVAITGMGIQKQMHFQFVCGWELIGYCETSNSFYSRISYMHFHYK